MKNIQMMNSLSILCSGLIFLAAFNGSVEGFQEYKVGDAMGWRQPLGNDSETFTHWAANKRFQVGDSLSFEYKNDSVLEVNKWGYYHCSTKKPLSAFTNGSTIIKLERAGPLYFISGTPNHCKKGQRLLVQAMLPRQNIASPPSIAAASPEAFMEPSSASPDEAFTGPSPARSLESSSGNLDVPAVSSVIVVIFTLFSLEISTH